MTADATPTDFRVLGSLEVIRDGATVPLGGPRRRAVLGYLLLHCGQAVPTSRLIGALWGDHPPPSARKGLQNAVWHLRAALSQGRTRGRGPELVTCAPGYLLRADAGDVDLLRFQELTDQGRASFAEGSVRAASGLWHRALALWRGRALADLAEAGFSWPELRALEESRLDVLEDFFDAELRLGHHDTVLAELQEAVRAEPRRERLLEQLMTALYRGGRQAEALAVYRRAESSLAETLGLEPGRALQELESAILAHAPELSQAAHEPTAVALTDGPHPPQAPDLRPKPAPESVRRDRRTFPAGVRTQATVLMLRATSGEGRHEEDGSDGPLAEVDRVALEEAARFGGNVVARLGATWLVLFADPRPHNQNHARRAVSAALAVRYRFAHTRWAAPSLGVRAVVATGDVVTRHSSVPATPLAVTGAVVDTCHGLLPRVPEHTVYVTEATRHCTRSAIVYRPAVPEGCWEAVGTRDPRPDGHPAPLIGRDDELASLMDLLSEPEGEEGPRVVTVIGEAGLGKSRLIDEFAARAAQLPGPGAPLVLRAPATLVDGSTLTVLAQGLRRCCGIEDGDSPQTAREKLYEAVRRAAPQDEERTLIRLHPLIGGDRLLEPPMVPHEVLFAWWKFMAGTATHRRLVVVVDELDFADDAVLDLVEGLAVVPARGRRGALLVVAGARPALLERRPHWESVRQSRTMSLKHLGAAAVRRYLTTVLDAPDAGSAGQGPRHPRLPSANEHFAGALAAVVPGNPRVVAAYIRDLLDPATAERPGAGEAALPGEVRRFTAARLDALPEPLRRVACDVAVLGEAAWSTAVAAAGGRRHEEVTGPLEELVDHGVLVARDTDPPPAAPVGHRYGFRHETDRQVARSRVPSDERACVHRAAVGWLATVADGHPQVATHLRMEALHLAAATSRPVPDLLECSLRKLDASPQAFADLDRTGVHYLILAETPATRLVELERVAEFCRRHPPG
ncbi:BTAD domain-containing putative transcriptional regulator [Streptomyces sp. NPDC001700]